jgi:hypothetical protein
MTPAERQRKRRTGRIDKKVYRDSAVTEHRVDPTDDEDWALFTKAAGHFLRQIDSHASAHIAYGAMNLIPMLVSSLKRLIEHWPNLSQDLKQQLAEAKDSLKAETLINRYVMKLKQDRVLTDGLTWISRGEGCHAKAVHGSYSVTKHFKGNGFVARWKTVGDKHGDILATLPTLEAAKAACEQHMRDD